ncbi:MAG: histidine triad nucleotide-binding protein [Endomicrobiales bacterium]|nr:histidine triad nucleotide-binding protein [Endomicrobiales bacterium]
MDCIFCKIVKREIPSQIVYENERILAFRDITPQAPVHILIIPKAHITGLNDISRDHTELLGEIQSAAKEIAEKENISSSGYRVVTNCGKNAGQAVDHLHYHILGGRKFSWPPG